MGEHITSGERAARLRLRLDASRKGSEIEAIAWLEELLDGANAGGAGETDATVRGAGLAALSIVAGFDAGGATDEDVMAEVHSDPHRSAELTELLRRLCDRAAPDRLRTVEAARSALRAVAEEVRAAERKRPKPSGALVAEARPSRTPGAGSRPLGIAAGGMLLVVLLLVIVVKVKAEVRYQRELHAPSATSSISGTRAVAWPVDRAAELRASTSWAWTAFASSRNDLAPRAEGAVDQYPECGTGRSWHPSEAGGMAALIVRFPNPVDARAVVVVESRNAGAVVAVDDLPDDRETKLGSGRTVRLWEAEAPPAGPALPVATEACRALVLVLPEPRPVSALRVVVDASRVPGIAHVDAVGLLTEGGMTDLHVPDPEPMLTPVTPEPHVERNEP